MFLTNNDCPLALGITQLYRASHIPDRNECIVRRNISRGGLPGDECKPRCHIWPFIPSLPKLMKERQNRLRVGGETGAQKAQRLGQACTVSHRWSLVESPAVLPTHLYTSFPLMTSSSYFTWARGILEVGAALGTPSSSEVVAWELARLVGGGGGGWPAFAPFPFLQKGPSNAKPSCDMSQGKGKLWVI